MRFTLQAEPVCGTMLRWFGCSSCCHASRASRTARRRAQPNQPNQPNSASLSWVRLAGAEQCIATHELARRVEARLGRRSFVSASQAELSFEGRIERDARHDAWLATVVVSDRQGRMLGRRELRARGAECAAIDSSLAYVFAWSW